MKNTEKKEKTGISKALKKVLKIKYLILLCILVMIVSLVRLFTINHYYFTADILSSYSLESNVDLDIAVHRKSDSSIYYRNNYYDDDDLSSKLKEKLKNDDVTLTVLIEDEDGKNIKGTKEKIKTEFDEKNQISIELPEGLEAGNYVLKLKAKKGLYSDITTTKLNFSKSVDNIITISMDKGIYKPGDDITFRALITDNVENKPTDAKVEVSIYDGNDNRVYFEETKTSEFGIITGKFSLSDEVNSGTYRLVVETEDTEKEKVFEVDTYTEERFEIEVAKKDAYKSDEKIEFDINTKYFFGEPVVDAKVVVTDIATNKDSVLKTNSEGIATYKGDVKNEGEYFYSIEITDTSNYYVASEESVRVSDTELLIDIVPEFGSLVKDVKNRIYVYVEDLKGNPIRTEARLQYGNISREFRTDSKGMGYIDIGSADISDVYTISVAVDTEEFGEVKKYKNFNVINKTNIIKTDKVLYAQGETVDIAIGNYDEEANQIYVVKNGELLQTLDITSDEQVLDLDKVYGLIDIYIKGKEEIIVEAEEFGKTTYSDESYDTNRRVIDFVDAVPWDYYSRNRSNEESLNKKTIFIKPDMSFKISLNTNKEEYKPAEEMVLKIANNDSKEAAYLVSIIDTANLNIADNDLNIDKIKLALEDIKFTDGVDAATVYAAIMAETDEGELEKLLTKQESKDFKLNSATLYNNMDTYVWIDALGIATYTLGIVLAIMIIYHNATGKKSPFIRFISVTLPIIIILTFMITTFINAVFDDMFEGIGLILGFILSIVLYNKKIKDYENIIGKNIWEIIYFAITLTAIAWLDEVLGEEILVIISVIAFLIIYAKRKTKVGSVIVNFVKTVLKTACMLVLTNVVAMIIYETLAISYRYEEFVILLTLIGLYYALYRYRKAKGKYDNEKEETKDSEEKKVDIFHYIGIGAVILVLLAAFINSSVGTFSSNISDDVVFDGAAVEVSPSLDVNQFTAKGDASISSSAADSSGAVNAFGSLADVFESRNSFSQSIEAEDTFIEETEEIKTTLDKETEEKVRSVFLECLTFMPEVVAEKGQKDVNIKLSDNITTWKVQVVGNTKDGDIAYETTEFRVFKEFFVDFTVPNNLKVGDRISIPATIYNYTDEALNVNLKVNEASWFKLHSSSDVNVNLASKGTELIYIDIEVLETGNNPLRLEASANNLKDIIEKVVPVAYQGLELSEISANGNTKEDVIGQALFTEDYIPGSGRIDVNIYPNLLSFAVEGMDSILRLPTGCFEQVSSSLYPDIMVLTYLEDNNDEENEELKQKAIEYINKGYQKLLTYEVDGEPGGFSLYGNPDAEVVLTAYGLLELNDLSKVYKIDEKVLERMESFLESKQNSDGSFEVKRFVDYALANDNRVALNAYVMWALSEYNPNSEVVEDGIEYIKGEIDGVDDPYTLALMVNVLLNAGDKEANEYLEELIDKVEDIDGKMHVTSNSRDYMGVYSSMDVQATALTSMALTKANKNDKINQELIDYIISRRSSTTWGNTHTTVFALRAINEYNKSIKTKEQTLDITVGGKTQRVELKENGVNFVSLTFDGISDEFVDYEISGIKANIYYEIVKKYNVDYENIEPSYKFEITRELYDHLNMQVNDVLSEVIIIDNISNDTVENAMVEIEIPQGFTVEKAKLDAMVGSGRIEKYETSYEKIYVYLRDIETIDEVMFEVEFRALYPVDVTGGAVRVYDYYNAEISEVLHPMDIVVK